MKALTLYQPWATLVAIGAKRIETRSWHTYYRGPLAIHAGMEKRYINHRSHDYICNEEPFYSVLMEAGALWHDNQFFGALPLGCIVATCELVNCKRIDVGDWFPANLGWWKNKMFWEASEREWAFGDHSVGRFMWFLANIKILDDPVPVKGSMGLWEWEEN
jgi:hypothetical protein